MQSNLHPRRSCDQLGICQARADCPHCPSSHPAAPFAPGVVDGPHQPTAKPWAWRLVAALSVIALVSLTLGYTLHGGALP